MLSEVWQGPLEKSNRAPVLERTQSGQILGCSGRVPAFHGHVEHSHVLSLKGRKLVGSDDAKVGSSTAESPEEVGVGGGITLY